MESVALMFDGSLCQLHNDYPFPAPPLSTCSMQSFVKPKSLSKPGSTSATKLPSQYRLRRSHPLTLRSHVASQEVIKIDLPNLSTFNILASCPYPSFRLISVTDISVYDGFPPVSPEIHVYHRSPNSLRETHDFKLSLIVDLSSHRLSRALFPLSNGFLDKENTKHCSVALQA
jgi:hypothetical protein